MTGGLLVVALVVGGTWVIGALAPEPAAPPPTAAPVAPAAPADPGYADPPAEPVADAAVAAATRWAEAFLYRPGQTKQQWLERLAPLTVAEFYGLLETQSNPDAAPRQVVAAAIPVSGAPGSAVVDVPSELGTLRLQLVQAADGTWLVSDADDAPRSAEVPAR